MKNYYLYLIRHGITQGNLDGKYIGQTDLSLCPEGKKQIEDLVAQEVYPEVEKVYSSPLARCLETAEIIYPEQKLMVIDEICEIVGVKDRFHFSRTFKKIYGVPPARYRRNYASESSLD